MRRVPASRTCHSPVPTRAPAPSRCHKAIPRRGGRAGRSGDGTGRDPAGRESQLGSAPRCCTNSGDLGGAQHPRPPRAPCTRHLLLLMAGRTRRLGSEGERSGRRGWRPAAARSGSQLWRSAPGSRIDPLASRSPRRDCACVRACVGLCVCLSLLLTARQRWAGCEHLVRGNAEEKEESGSEGLQNPDWIHHRKGRSNSWFQTDKLLRRKQALRWEGGGGGSRSRQAEPRTPTCPAWLSAPPARSSPPAGTRRGRGTGGVFARGRRARCSRGEGGGWIQACKPC